MRRRPSARLQTQKNRAKGGAEEAKRRVQTAWLLLEIVELVAARHAINIEANAKNVEHSRV